MWNAFGGTRFIFALLFGFIGLTAIACASSGTVESIDTNEVTLEPLASFFIEARIQVDVDESALPFPPDGPIISNLRWWFEAPDRFRWELDTPDSPYLSGSSFIVSDGERWVSYDTNLNRYQSGPALEFPDGVVPAPPSGILIGPLRGGSLENWIIGVRLSQPRFDAKLLRVAELLDRRVGVYEFSPVGVYLDTEGTIATESTGRIWLDESSGLVLRYEGPDSNNVTAEVTRLEINRDIDDERFTFIAPAGAIEADRTTGSITLSGSVGGTGKQSIPPGLLEISVQPEFAGIVVGGSSTGQSMGIVHRAENNWTWADGRALRVRQFVRTSGLAARYISDEQVFDSRRKNRLYNVLRTDDGTVISLVWQDGDVSVIVDGVDMELDELIEVANSIRRPGVELTPEG